MKSIKNSHTWLVIVFTTLLFCWIGLIYLPRIISDFSINYLFQFLLIIFFILSIALLVVLFINSSIYKKNLAILEYKYHQKLRKKSEEVMHDTKPLYLEKWFDEISKAEYKSEKEVETKFIYPFIRFLGYKFNHVHMQYSMKIPIGRQTVHAIADFVIDNPNTYDPVFVVEAKHPTQILNTDVQNQARSYAFTLNASYYLITNGISLSLYKRGVSQDLRLLAIDIKNLQQHWDKLNNILGIKSIKFKKS